jgi:hypothetical protein
MIDENYFEEALENIREDKLDVEAFIKDIDVARNREIVLNSIRNLIVDEKHRNKLSFFCSIIKGLKDVKSLPIIWELLLSDSTKGHRGSLVYAMEDMNPIEYLEQLVDLIITDNFEVLSNAMNTINNLEGTVDRSIIDKCITKINTVLHSEIPTWRREALLILLDELEND